MSIKKEKRIFENNLESERLILRRFKESDVDTFHQYRSDPSVARYQGWDAEEFTKENSTKFIKEHKNFDIGFPDTWFQISIEIKDSKTHIGDV